MNGKAWTAAEDRYLKRNYRQGARHCATHLGRSVCSVYQRANNLKLTKPMLFLKDERLHAAVEQWHPLGWSDTEISEALERETKIPVDRHRISKIRKSLGLPENKCSSHQRERVAAKTREQLTRSGHPSLAAVRGERWNQWKREQGWPDDLTRGLTIRAVQALEMFYHHGPLTRVQLCVLMGVSPKKRVAPTSNAKGGTVLAELQAAGLITRLPKAVQVPFDLQLHMDPSPSKPRKTNRNIRSKWIDLYFLNPGVKKNDERQTQAS